MSADGNQDRFNLLSDPADLARIRFGKAESQKGFTNGVSLPLLIDGKEILFHFTDVCLWKATTYFSVASNKARTATPVPWTKPNSKIKGPITAKMVLMGEQVKNMEEALMARIRYILIKNRTSLGLDDDEMLNKALSKLSPFYSRDGRYHTQRLYVPASNGSIFTNWVIDSQNARPYTGDLDNLIANIDMQPIWGQLVMHLPSVFISDDRAAITIRTKAYNFGLTRRPENHTEFSGGFGIVNVFKAIDFSAATKRSATGDGNDDSSTDEDDVSGGQGPGKTARKRAMKELAAERDKPTTLAGASGSNNSSKTATAVAAAVSTKARNKKQLSSTPLRFTVSSSDEEDAAK